MRRPIVKIVAGCLVVSACAGCASQPPSTSGRPTLSDFRIVYSPNGEPLTGGPLGRRACDDAIAGWFGRADANHDGFVDREEFLADARAQFARMDQDHSGILTAAKLALYRQPYQDAPPPNVQMARPPAGEASGEAGKRLKAQDQEDPVMSADKTLSFKVGQDDYMSHAVEVFQRLDSGRQGRLNVAAVVSWGCSVRK